MNLIALIILSIYHLVGLSHGPAQAHFQDLLQPAAPQITIEMPAAAQTVAMPTSRQIAGGVSTSSIFGVQATAAYAVDIDSGKPLFGSGTAQLPIASLTKIITALVLLQSHQAGETITIPTLPTYDPADALLHIHAGTQFKFQDLLAAALIPSDNDAAESLAIADSGTLEAFSAKMNQLTTLWHIDDTHFASASGLTDTDNSASAVALAKLAEIGLHNDLFAKDTSTASMQISDLSGQSYSLATTNQLLGTRTTGIKTGYTPAAGECFVGLATIQGHRVITVILGSNDRFGETAKLLDYLDRTYTWQ